MENVLCIKEFQFDGRGVRIIEKDGEPWFVAADVCTVLSIGNSRDAVARLDDDEKDDVGITDTIGRGQTATAINESGLYSLILTSRKPEAKPFKKWVTSEVLPSIRKTGSYSAASQIPQTLPEALRLAADLAERLEFQTQLAAAGVRLVSEMKPKIEEMEPKAAFFDTVTESRDAIDIGSVAKVLNMGIGRTRLFEFLRNESILMPNNQPYQKYIDDGLFRVIESKFDKADGSTHVYLKTVVYQKGVDFIRKRLAKSRS